MRGAQSAEGAGARPMAAPQGRGAAAAPAPPHPALLPLSAICPASAPHRLPPTQPANRFFAQLLGLSTFELSHSVSLKWSRTLFSRFIVLQSRSRSAAGDEIYLFMKPGIQTIIICGPRKNAAKVTMKLASMQKFYEGTIINSRDILDVYQRMRRQMDLRTTYCN